jgi:hypothetical protein
MRAMNGVSSLRNKEAPGIIGIQGSLNGLAITSFSLLLLVSSLSSRRGQDYSGCYG